jgi:cytochrome c
MAHMKERSMSVIRLPALAGAALATLLLATPGFAQDAKEGEKAFAKCRACHSLEDGKNGVGPSLHGVLGRKSGTAPKFNYSKAMADKGVTWDEKTLAAYLSDPKAYIPGNKMTFPGIKKDSEMQDLLAYLKTATK